MRSSDLVSALEFLDIEEYVCIGVKIKKEAPTALKTLSQSLSHALGHTGNWRPVERSTVTNSELIANADKSECMN